MIGYSQLGRMGQFGNQLFQVAATVALAARHNDEAVFPEWQYNHVFKKQVRCNDFSWVRNIYTEPTFAYSPINYKPDTDLKNSYFQSEKYFADYADLIREQFDFVDGTVTDEQIKNASESCSIHIRRTDYVALAQYHPFPGMQYYMSAISNIEEMGIKKFMIFSDDIQWCIDAFGNNKKFTYIVGQSNVQDMCLMSKCHSNIIANSSFSWWGAWLNQTETKRVISPAVWFGPGNAHVSTIDLYCENWEIL